MPDKNCLECNDPLPKGSNGNKKYCNECKKIVKSRQNQESFNRTYYRHGSFYYRRDDDELYCHYLAKTNKDLWALDKNCQDCDQSELMYYLQTYNRRVKYNEGQYDPRFLSSCLKLIRDYHKKKQDEDCEGFYSGKYYEYSDHNPDTKDTYNDFNDW